MEEKKHKRIIPVEVKFTNMSHWGDIHILPNLQLCVNYSMPTIIFNWWIFRIDIVIYKHFPDWFMKYVWNTLNLDFSWLKKQKDEYGEEY